MWTLMKRQSLFVKIFLSFLTIILLFVSFHMISFQFFTDRIQTEIIQHNQLSLRNTADRYQTHFTRIKTLLFSLYHEEKLVAFNRQLVSRPDAETNYWLAGEPLKEVRSHAYNPMFYLDNLIILFTRPAFVIEKEGTSDSDLFFSRFYQSPVYTADYWSKLSQQSGIYLLHPAEVFRVTGLNSDQNTQLLPISFQMPGKNYRVIALLDAAKMLKAFHSQEKDPRFMILNPDGSLLYRSSQEISTEGLPFFDRNEDYQLKNGFYYFAVKDKEAQLTFVTAVPYSYISSQVSKLNMTMYIILAISVAIGITVSWLLSRGINRPLKQIVASILHRNPGSVDNAIHEFDLIHREMHELIREKEEIHTEMLSKNSLLTSYGYINKLKAINSDINDWKDVLATDQPYVIIMYQLQFRSAPAGGEPAIVPEKAAYYIREYIRVLMSERFPSSHTFQIENNQILSFVTMGENPHVLDSALAQLKQILDRDRQYLLVTIAVSPVYRHSSGFNEAYRIVLQMLEQARPVEETQLITTLHNGSGLFLLTPSQEQELNAALLAGNERACMLLIERVLDQMAKKDASLQQYRRIGEGMVERVCRVQGSFGYHEDMAALQEELNRQLKDCYSVQQFKEFYRMLFSECAAIVNRFKADKDDTLEFIMNSVENRYAEDISLDLLADKLNMSAAYLSVYIKEKTGMNFSDHINQVRVRKAKQLLVETDLNMNDIGLQIGYRNVTSFNRMFKKLTGMAPGEYRKQHTLLREGEPIQ